MSRVPRRSQAQADIRTQAFDIADDNPDAARRCLAAVESSLALAGLRMHTVRGFESYLIFYRPLRDGIELVHVLHPARDVGAIPRAEPGPDEDG